ncbi:MAG: ATP-binding protein, partial [Frankiales bacterium]|nr:ATP-binding protein [Frankiales bacterium]
MLLFLDQAPRLLEDHRGLQALAAEVDWLSKVEWTLSEKGEVCVNFDLIIGSKTFEAVLVFAGLYPDVPAFVRPRDATQRWSIHQYPTTGTLCLEWGPDNWRSDITAADLIRSTYQLLVSESAGALRIPVPSRHSLTLGQQLRGKSWRLYFPPAVREVVIADATAPMTPLTVHTALRFWEFVGYVGDVNGVSLATGVARSPPELVDHFLGGWYTRQGWILHCDEITSLVDGCTVSAFKAFAAGKGHSLPWTDVKTISAFIVLVDAEKHVRALSVPTDETGDVSEYALFQGPETGKRVPDAYAALADKKVAVVGLGSIGSKVAVSLARSGVSKFVLVDDDIVLPENLSRNQLDWLSIGFS